MQKRDLHLRLAGSSGEMDCIEAMKSRGLLRTSVWPHTSPLQMGDQTIREPGWTSWTSPVFMLTVGVCSEQIYSTSMLTDMYTAFSVCTTTDI